MDVRNTLDQLIKSHSPEELTQTLLPQVLQSTRASWSSDKDLLLTVAQWIEQVLSMGVEFKHELLEEFLKVSVGSQDVQVVKQALVIQAKLPMTDTLMDAFALILDDRQKLQEMPLHAHQAIRCLTIKCVEQLILREESESQEMLELMQRHLKMSMRVDLPNVPLCTALVNCLAFIGAQLSERREQIVKLLLELVQRKHSGARQHIYVNKSLKNGLCFLLRQYDIGKDLSFEVLDYLSKLSGNHIRADLHYLGNIVTKRGHKREQAAVPDDDYEALLEQEMLETTTVSLAQVSTEAKVAAVKDVLQQFTKDANHPFLGKKQLQYVTQQTPFQAPDGFDPSVMGVDIVASIVLASLYSFGAGLEDGGVASWKSVMDSSRQETTKRLNLIAKAELEKQSKNKVKEVVRKPFRLEPAPMQPGMTLLYDQNGLVDIEKCAELRQQVHSSIKQIISHILEYSPFGQHLAANLPDNYEEEDEEDESMQQQNDAAVTKPNKDDFIDSTLSLLDAHGAQWLYQRSTERSMKRVHSSDEMVTELNQAVKKIKSAEDDEEMSDDFGLVPMFAQAPVQQIVNSVQQFKGSRAYWSLMLSRFISHFSQTEWFVQFQQSQELKPKELQLIQAQFQELGQQKEMSSQLVNITWIDFLVRDFMSRWDVAVRWLFEEYYCALAQDNLQSFIELVLKLLHCVLEVANSAQTQNVSGTIPYIPWMPQHGQSTVFKKFLMTLPLFPQSFLTEQLSLWCNVSFASAIPTPLERFKLQLGLDCVYDVINQFGSQTLRDEGLRILLNCCVSPEKSRRSEAIRVVRRWWSVEQTSEPVTGNLDDDAPQVSSSFSRSQKQSFFISQITVFATKSLENLVNPCDTNQWTDEKVLRWLDLYVVLCVRDASLFSHLFDIYAQLSNLSQDEKQLVESVILAAVQKIVSFIGMPSEDNENAAKILDVIEHCTSEKNIELSLKVALSMMQSLSMEQMLVKCSPLFTDFFIRMQQKNPQLFSSPLFLTCTLPAVNLSKQEVYKGLLVLADFLLADNAADKNDYRDLFCATIARILSKHPNPDSKPNPKSYEFIHPVDVGVMFHCLDLEPIKDAPVLPLKKNLEVVSLFFNHPLLQSFFTASNLCYTFTECLSKVDLPKDALKSIPAKHLKFEPKVPKLLMRTVLDTYKRFKLESATYILTHVLTRCVSFRSLWSGAKLDKKQTSNDDQARAKALWEGWVRLLKMLAPQSFGLLIRIPQANMKQILDKCGSDTIQSFKGWIFEQVATQAKTAGRSKFKIAENVIAEIEAEQQNAIDDKAEVQLQVEGVQR